MSPIIDSSDAPKFFSMNEAVEKLLSTWEKHGTLIVAVDFDDTMFNYSKDPRKDFTQIHDVLRECVKLGLRIVIFTARPKPKWAEVVEFCNDIDLKIEGINKNLIDVDNLGIHGKIYYNLLLDDKAGLSQAYVILKKTLRAMKAMME